MLKEVLKYLKDNWSFILSILSIVASFTALVLTAQQTRLNNKQHLFDRRLKNYKIVMGILSLCKQNYSHIDNAISSAQNEPCFYAENLFIWLTNNTYMEKQSCAIKQLLEEPAHKEFLIKLEELRDISTEIDLIFNCQVSAKKIGAFILAYADALMGLYKYQMIIERMNAENKKNPMTLEKAQKLVSENSHRNELLEVLMDLLVKYDAASQQEVDEELRKQIALR